MKLSKDYGQHFSKEGYAWADVPAEPRGRQVLYDPRRLKEGLTDDAFNELLHKDPVIFVSKKGGTELLCKKFADLHLSAPEQAQADILKFANQYGLLGTGNSKTFVTSTGRVVYAEPLEEWQQEAWQMHMAWERFHLASLCQRKDLEGYDLLKYKDALRKLFIEDEKNIERDFASRPDVLKMCADGDFINSELVYVGLMVDKRLKRLTSLQLSLPEGSEKLEMQTRVTTLLGALWLQFAEYVTGVKQINFCRVCGKIIPIVGKGARIDNDLCKKGGCRDKASRQSNTKRRKRKAADASAR